MAHEQVELGRVAWIRDLDQAQKLSRKTARPIFIQFDEVPGCHTVQTYGREVLTDPVVLETLHHLTVPLLVRNNVEGWERDLLNRFDEPTWNNPVSRLVTADLDPLGPRQTGLASADVLQSVRAALGEQAPPWLVVLADERAGVELSDAGSKDDRHHLRRSDWARVPMSPAQEVKVNAAIRDRADPRPWLTPAQIALHDG